MRQGPVSLTDLSLSRLLPLVRTQDHGDEREVAGGGDHSQMNGAHDQRAMEEDRKEYAYLGCAALVVSAPFIQKVRDGS